MKYLPARCAIEAVENKPKPNPEPHSSAKRLNIKLTPTFKNSPLVHFLAVHDLIEP
jgi:hypothetical protein